MKKVMAVLCVALPAALCLGQTGGSGTSRNVGVERVGRLARAFPPEVMAPAKGLGAVKRQPLCTSPSADRKSLVTKPCPARPKGNLDALFPKDSPAKRP